MFIESIVIENKTKNRFLFLYVKFFLEICGYEVLESSECKPVSSENCSFRKLIFTNEKEKDTEGTIYLQVNICKEQIISNLCAKLTVSDIDRECLLGIAKIYDSKLFKDLYVVTYLYASRLANYSNEKMLLHASKSLSSHSNNMEKILSNGKYTWREIYGYLYLANKTNEGLSKLNAYSYRTYDTLKHWIDKLKQMEGFDENSFLLEANIICNTSVNIRDSIEAYKKLQYSNFYCTRFWALYELGICLLKVADAKYRRVYEDDDCRIKVELNEPAIEVFTKGCEMKEDEIRILYKIALHDERRGLCDSIFLKIALEKFQKIAKYINMIPKEQWTTLEFEYLYKTYIRIGSINKLQGNYGESQQSCENAQKLWNNLQENYRLFNEIFGEDADSAREVLDKRHKNRNRLMDLL